MGIFLVFPLVSYIQHNIRTVSYKMNPTMNVHTLSVIYAIFNILIFPRRSTVLSTKYFQPLLVSQRSIDPYIFPRMNALLASLSVSLKGNSIRSNYFLLKSACSNFKDRVCGKRFCRLHLYWKAFPSNITISHGLVVGAKFGRFQWSFLLTRNWTLCFCS